eukprot:CAMPEP_0116874244 /NCGR_PEP_ID=MMETSP0463-20121206/5681_1 /TAXON_ID=181622 /ORGANISM="Strombidinopsis sp, Strain SopsisLIS2011" /LENGTH=98 /DNA_ID=CAMNT_0004517645 /DNA_START=959 /DNA_END=1255 /DNA_ORIENTATION=+
MPQLYNQVIQDVTKTETKAEELTDLVSQGAKSSSRAHKEAILKEFKRKEEQEKLRLRQQKEKEEATAARKKKRAALREQDRLEKLGAKILANVINVAS